MTTRPALISCGRRRLLADSGPSASGSLRPKVALKRAAPLAFIIQPLGLWLGAFVDALWKDFIFISSMMKMSGTVKGRNCQTKPKHSGEATSQQRKWRPKAFETVASCSGIASSSAARTTGPLARSTLAM